MPELYPYNRQEIFLKGILDDDPESLPDPETREEIYLKAIAEKPAGYRFPPIESGDAGKVLTVNEDENGVEWKAQSGGLVYQHNIVLNFFNQTTALYTIYFSVVTSKSDAYTSFAGLQADIYSDSVTKTIPATGACIINNDHCLIRAVTISSAATIGVSVLNIKTSPNTGTYFQLFGSSYNLTPTAFTDKVISI